MLPLSTFAKVGGKLGKTSDLEAAAAQGDGPLLAAIKGWFTSSLKSFLKWASEGQIGGRGHAGRAVKFVTGFDAGGKVGMV